MWKVTVKVSPGRIGQLVWSHPVDEPLADPSSIWLAAHSKPVPSILVPTWALVPSGQPLYQQQSEKAELMAM